MRTHDKMVAIIALFVALIFIGQIVSYSDVYHTSIAATDDDYEISYVIETNYLTEYSVVSLDNGQIQCKEYIVLMDEKYYQPNGQDYTTNAIKHIIKEMGYRGLDIRTVSAESLLDIIEQEITSNIFDVGVIILSGSVPDIIHYDLTNDRYVLKEWLELGGSLFWAGSSPFGKYICGENGVEELEDYSLFYFGAENVIRDSGRDFFPRTLEEGSLTDILSIYYNECTYGLNLNNLPPGTKALCLDYSEEGYSSVSAVQVHGGVGRIVVFGGGVSKTSAPFIAQTIASGISYDTKIIDHVESIKNKGSVSGTIAVNSSGYTTVYIFLGNFEVNIGKRWTF